MERVGVTELGVDEEDPAGDGPSKGGSQMRRRIEVAGLPEGALLALVEAPLGIVEGDLHVPLPRQASSVEVGPSANGVGGPVPALRVGCSGHAPLTDVAQILAGCGRGGGAALGGLLLGLVDPLGDPIDVLCLG